MMAFLRQFLALFAVWRNDANIALVNFPFDYFAAEQFLQVRNDQVDLGGIEWAEKKQNINWPLSRMPVLSLPGLFGQFNCTPSHRMKNKWELRCAQYRRIQEPVGVG